MNSIKMEDIIIPDYETLMNCIYEKFMSDIGQEFDYENYDKALDKIDQLVSSSDYTELEHTITQGFENSAQHGFLMGARMTMMLLFGWQQGSGIQNLHEFLTSKLEMPARQQDSGGKDKGLNIMGFMKGGKHNG